MSQESLPRWFELFGISERFTGGAFFHALFRMSWKCRGISVEITISPGHGTDMQEVRLLSGARSIPQVIRFFLVA